MAIPASLFHSKTMRSDQSDNYYDERASYQHINAARGVCGNQQYFRGTLSDKNINLDHLDRQCTEVTTDDMTTAHQAHPETVHMPKIDWSAKTDHNSGAFEGGEDNRRVAEWVETQQASEHITLPLDSFESLIDRLIATEEAMERLKAVAFSCVREAHRVWRRPDDTRHEHSRHTSDTDGRHRRGRFQSCSIGIPRSDGIATGNDGSVSALNEEPPPHMCCNLDASRVAAFENDDAEASGTRTLSEYQRNAARAMERQGLCSLSSQIDGERIDSPAAKQTSDVTSKAVTLPTSWLDDSSSQSSRQSHVPAQIPGNHIRIVTSSPSIMGHKEGNIDRRVKTAQSTVASFNSVQNSSQNIHADRPGTASRVEARLRNGVDKFLLKIRPSRHSLQQSTASTRSPVTVWPQELDAYLALPTDALQSAGTAKMTPRSPRGERRERTITSRRSAPLLRA